MDPAVIHRTHDAVLPSASGLALQTAFPGSTLVTLRGAGLALDRVGWPAIVDASARHTEPGGA